MVERAGPASAAMKRFIAALVVLTATAAHAEQSPPGLQTQSPSEPSPYERAETEAREALARAGDGSGSGAAETEALRDAAVRAAIRNGRAWSPEVRTEALAALASREAARVDAATLAVSLVNAGDVLVADAQYQRGIALLRRAVALAESDATASLTHANEYRIRLGLALVGDGRHEEALQHSIAGSTARVLLDLAATSGWRRSSKSWPRHSRPPASTHQPALRFVAPSTCGSVPNRMTQDSSIP